MSALKIDFAPRSAAQAWHAASLRARLCLLLGLVGCVAAALAVHGLSDTLGEAVSARQQAEAAGQVQARRAPPAGPATVPDEQAAAVNRAVGQLNLPWHDVFVAIEQATPDSVALLQLTPDARHDLVRIVAEAGRTEDMLRYVERLKQQPFLAQVHLTKHEVNQDDHNLPLRFQLEAQWREAP